MADTQASVYLSHIISQTKQNIDFLVSQNVITPAEGNLINSKLSGASDASILSLSQQTHQLAIAPPSMPSAGPGHTATSMPSPSAGPGPGRRNIPPPPQRTVRARAIWGYNEEGKEPDDLPFREGEIIEIISETNADWWMGRANGRQGLFPSNYITKLEGGGGPPSRSPAPPAPSFPSQPQYGPPPGAYAPPPSNYQSPPPPSMYQSPPPGNKEGAMYQPAYAAPPMHQPPPAAPVVVQQQQPEQPKKNRFGGMGNTLATAAVGGLGFGAGSAIGSDLVNSIF